MDRHGNERGASRARNQKRMDLGREGRGGEKGWAGPARGGWESNMNTLQSSTLSKGNKYKADREREVYAMYWLAN